MAGSGNLDCATRSHRLAAELRLLYKCEAEHKLPAAPVVRQLIAWEQGVMPDVVPPVPQWVAFEWPRNNQVNLESWWRQCDMRTVL